MKPAASFMSADGRPAHRHSFVVAVETSENKSRNVGTIIRCAAALGAEFILIVGRRKINTHGSHGAQTRIRVVHCFYWHEAQEYLRSVCLAERVYLYGIARRPNELSCPVTTFGDGFDRSSSTQTTVTVFVVGNSDGALSCEVGPLLDATLHVDLLHAEFEGRFHPDAVLTICLHHFVNRSRIFLGKSAPSIIGEKFSLDPIINHRGKVVRACREIKSVSSVADGADAAPWIEDQDQEDEDSIHDLFS